MRQTERDLDHRETPETSHSMIDWRGWVTLVWVVWFGLLYGRMVLDQRGGKVRAVLGVKANPGNSSTSRVLK